MKLDPIAPEALHTEEELVVELAARLAGRGSGARLARKIGISQGGLSNVLTNGRGIGPRIAGALGYRKVTRYERVR